MHRMRHSIDRKIRLADRQPTYVHSERWSPGNRRRATRSQDRWVGLLAEQFRQFLSLFLLLRDAVAGVRTCTTARVNDARVHTWHVFTAYGVTRRNQEDRKARGKRRGSRRVHSAHAHGKGVVNCHSDRSTLCSIRWFASVVARYESCTYFNAMFQRSP